MADSPFCELCTENGLGVSADVNCFYPLTRPQLLARGVQRPDYPGYRKSMCLACYREWKRNIQPKEGPCCWNSTPAARPFRFPLERVTPATWHPRPARIPTFSDLGFSRAASSLACVLARMENTHAR